MYNIFRITECRKWWGLEWKSNKRIRCSLNLRFGLTIEIFERKGNCCSSQNHLFQNTNEWLLRIKKTGFILGKVLKMFSPILVWRWLFRQICMYDLGMYVHELYSSPSHFVTINYSKYIIYEIAYRSKSDAGSVLQRCSFCRFNVKHWCEYIIWLKYKNMITFSSIG